jgi:hypothetical protein
MRFVRFGLGALIIFGLATLFDRTQPNRWLAGFVLQTGVLILFLGPYWFNRDMSAQRYSIGLAYRWRLPVGLLLLCWGRGR